MIETRKLRDGDTVLVYPSPLQHRRMHKSTRADWPGTVAKTVRYTTPIDADPARRNWRDVVFTDGTWASAPASSMWITTDGLFAEAWQELQTEAAQQG